MKETNSIDCVDKMEYICKLMKAYVVQRGIPLKLVEMAARVRFKGFHPAQFLVMQPVSVFQEKSQAEAEADRLEKETGKMHTVEEVENGDR